MADLVVIVPSRERPEAAAELASAFASTCAANTRLMFAVDADDPCAEAYRELVGRFEVQVAFSSNHAQTMVFALNREANGLSGRTPAPFAIGFMGDDHRPRTVGWDKEYLDALRELGTGIVYGNDLLQGEKLPTQCAMTSDIVRALGYMAPPTLRHMYVDNFWLDLGRAAGCLQYLPDVVIEHMHPIANKADWDEGYKRVNDHAVYDADSIAYGLYGRDQFPADLAKVRALRDAR